jgi:prepilin-type processing-associated H-X9-DG protein
MSWFQTSGLALQDQLTQWCISFDRYSAVGSRFQNSWYGGNWVFASPMFLSYDHNLPPNQPACSGLLLDHDSRADVTPPSSLHPGGVNLVFCDGSARFVKNAVNRAVWWSLGTRAGGEVISATDY